MLWFIRYRVDPKCHLAIPDAGQIGEGIETITSMLWFIRYSVDPKFHLAIPDAGQIGEGIETVTVRISGPCHVQHPKEKLTLIYVDVILG